ncbi:FAD-dependent oxidoreductase [Halosolutus amylolyticus]|uniref:FAD-dependent oxidoreductase n=1 Tax=Halosolutus amylolyticus TaxID=2932267 RepID=A0ABD5PRC5_9EURY|nr:FAD-dependent oxidoreductase [Halosolutus amylolyticus]
MIAVVGGTCSGLAAAARLAERGHDVRVVDASDEIGGLARTAVTNGDPIETVPVSLSRPEDDRACDLLADLGLDAGLEWHPTRSGRYVDGTVHPIDAPWEFLALPDLSFGDTARLAALTSGVDGSGLPRSLPERGAYDDHAAFAGVPAREFLHTHASSRVYDRFVEPVLAARFGSHAPDVSAAWVLDHLRADRETTRFGRPIRGYLAGSAARLVDALVETIGPERIHTNARVTEVAVGDAVESITVDRAGESGTETWAVDAVVIATGPAPLAELTGHGCSLPMQTRTCVRVATTTALTDLYRVTMDADAPFDELVAHTALVPADRYDGHHQYYLLDGGTAAARDRSTGAIERRWIEALAERFAAFDPNDLRTVETARFRQPVYEASYRTSLVPIDLADDVADGVYYAGIASAPHYPERRLGGAIDAGVACADRLDGRDRDRRARRQMRL